jgi:hypothetical protein
VSATIFRRSVYACLPAMLFCARAQKVRINSFISYSCHLTISFRCVDVRDLRIYGTVLSLWAHNIIRYFSHSVLISRHAMNFTCYYIILFISCFHSRCSMLSLASVLLSKRTQTKSKCFFGFDVFPTQNTANR